MSENDDLKERVQKFQTLSLPGQGMSMHMGTSYLVNDLWREVLRLREDGYRLTQKLAQAQVDLEVKQGLLDDAIRKGLQLCEQNGTLLMEAHTRDAEIAEARRRLEELENAEYVYRSDHDVIGDGDIRTGHSWDHMRHSGDRARAFLAAKAERKS
jgi:hypothetical protein